MISLILVSSKYALLFLEKVGCLIDCDVNIPLKYNKLIDGLLLDLMYILFCTRVWFLYFHLRSSSIITESKWWKLISDQQYEQRNFFLKHRTTPFGSFGKLKKYLCLGYIILAIIEFITNYFLPIDYYGFVNSFWLSLMMIFMIVILYKMPNYDNFLIRKELIIQVSIWIFAAMWFTFVILSQLQRHYVIFATLSQFVAMFGSMAVMFCMVLYPLYKFNHDKNAFAVSENIRTNTEKKGKDGVKRVMAWSEYVGKNKDNFNGFMEHLSKEWAVENLCFILETMQFKHKWKSDELEKIGYYFELPSDLPLSDIVYVNVDGSNNDNDMIKQIIMLTDKYVNDRADLCINVSYNIRNQILIKVNKLRDKSDGDENVDILGEQKDELFLIFDDSLKEIAYLLDDAWRRFNH